MLSKSLESTLHRSLSIAREHKHEYATFEHLLLALLDDKNAKSVLESCNVSIENLSSKLKRFLKEELTALVVNDVSEIKPTAGFQRIVHRAAIHVQVTGQSTVTGANLLAEFFFEHESYAAIFLKEENLTRVDVINKIEKRFNLKNESLKNDSLDSDVNKNFKSSIIDGDSNFKSEKDGVLEVYCSNLNKKAANGKIDVLIGREDEVERTIEIMCRRHKNNPLLVGDPGVGKTAIAEGLAFRIVNDKVPRILKDSVIYSLDIGSLVAGTRYRGDFEDRIKSVIKEISSLENAILFIDEIHTLIGAGSTNGGALDAGNLLKPALARGEIRCIGSTTFKEYSQYFEKDMALVRRFQKIVIDEPDVEGSIRILKGLKSYYEKHHNVRYSMESLEAAVTLSERYIHDRYLPDKAIDVMDEAGAHKRILDQEGAVKVSVSDIEEVVSKISQIPSISISSSDREGLQDLESKLCKIIFGQDDAIHDLCSSIKLAKAGLKNKDKPIGSYLFVGSTGVGKTELAKQIALLSNMELIRFDMSEYIESHSVSRLIGSPPGYVGFNQGGLLTDSVAKSPYSVLLFDEIEKSNKDVYNLLLQIMDYGKLTDSSGKVVNFTNTIIVMTTNAGISESSSIGFSNDFNSSSREVRDEINKIFPPEFRSRLDSVVYFDDLNKIVMKKIINKLLDDLSRQLADKKVKIKLDKTARDYIFDKGFSKYSGARMIEKFIENEVKQNIANEILFGSLRDGGKAYIRSDDNKSLQFEFRETRKIKA